MRCSSSSPPGRDRLLQPLVPSQAEDVVDIVVLTPAHQILASEAAVGTQPDLHRRSSSPDQPHDLLQLLACAGTAVDIAASKLCEEGEVVPEDVQRQVAVALVVAMEEPTFLSLVDGVIGGICVQDDALRRLVEAVEFVCDLAQTVRDDEYGPGWRESVVRAGHGDGLRRARTR